MVIDISTVKHLAKLSRLRFNEEELHDFTEQLDEIFNYAKSLQDIDTEGIAPSTHALPLQNVFKEDAIHTCKDIDKLLENAPDIENNSYKVPRILTN